MLSGTAGYTYGGNGIWQVTLAGQPKITYGNYPVPAWQEAMKLPGSAQVGIGHKILAVLPWHRMSPHPEWVSVEADKPLDLSGSHWIWFPEGNPAVDAPVAKRYFRRLFTMQEGKKPVNVRLKLSADDAFTVWFNGKELGSYGNWKSGREFDNLLSQLKSGPNVIAVMGENSRSNVTANPAGLIGLLQVDYSDGTSERVATDGLWRSSTEGADGWNVLAFNDTSWSQALVVARYGEGPWGTVAAESNRPQPFCAGIPGEMRIAYLPVGGAAIVSGLETGRGYSVEWINPSTGHRTPAGEAKGDAGGVWHSATPPAGSDDWLLLLQAQ